MDDEVYTQAVRQRIHLPPCEDLFDMCYIGQCYEPLAYNYSHQSTVSRDATHTNMHIHHHMSCIHAKRKHITTRHDMILNKIIGLAHEAGYATKKEPYSRINNEHGKKPDIKLISSQVQSNGSITLCDISIVHPCAPTYVRQARNLSLAGADRREKEKHSKYDGIAIEEKAKFVPLVLETYGAYGKQLKKFVYDLTTRQVTHKQLNSNTYQHTCLLHHNINTISVALQVGNARIAMHHIKTNRAYTAKRVRQAQAKSQQNANTTNPAPAFASAPAPSNPNPNPNRTRSRSRSCSRSRSRSRSRSPSPKPSPGPGRSTSKQQNQALDPVCSPIVKPGGIVTLNVDENDDDDDGDSLMPVELEPRFVSPQRVVGHSRQIRKAWTVDDGHGHKAKGRPRARPRIAIASSISIKAKGAERS